MNLSKCYTNPIFQNRFNNHIIRHPYHLQPYRPSANIIDNDESFEIALAVPGMNKKDFNIDLDEDLLTISSKIEKKDEKKYSKREFNYNNFSRSFSLPELIDRENINAEYKNGILKLTLPKKEEAKAKLPKNIDVS